MPTYLGFREEYLLHSFVGMRHIVPAIRQCTSMQKLVRFECSTMADKVQLKWDWKADLEIDNEQLVDIAEGDWEEY